MPCVPPFSASKVRRLESAHFGFWAERLKAAASSVFAPESRSSTMRRLAIGGEELDGLAQECQVLPVGAKNRVRVAGRVVSGQVFRLGVAGEIEREKIAVEVEAVVRGRIGDEAEFFRRETRRSHSRRGGGSVGGRNLFDFVNRLRWRPDARSVAKIIGLLPSAIHLSQTRYSVSSMMTALLLASLRDFSSRLVGCVIRGVGPGPADRVDGASLSAPFEPGRRHGHVAHPASLAAGWRDDVDLSRRRLPPR